MNVSGVSPVSATYNNSMPVGTVDIKAAESATEAKGLKFQDEIAISLINNVQDQQKVIANHLIGMMENMIDIYA